MRLAVWGHPYLEYPQGEDSADAMAQRLGALRAAGIDLLFPFVAVEGEHYFHSESLGEPDRDLLEPLMAAAREVGMQVHPIVGIGGPLSAGAHRYQPPLDASAIPEYALSWACASWGENHERSILLANEMIERYHPDGIHLDYSRYPNAEVLAQNPCACARCREARLRWLGKPLPEPQDLLRPGMAYKELQMRIEFVRSYVESMRGLTDHHEIALSAAVRARYYEDALVEGQDWADWCAEGLIDICCPMSYTLSFGTFAQWMARHRRLTADSAVTWLAGIGLKSSAGELPLDEAERQIRFARRAGADGIAVFSAGALDDQALQLLGELAPL